MNTYITFACLLAVFGLSQGSGYGYGASLISSVVPVSTANLIKAPIPIIKTHVAPIVTAPIVSPIVTAPVLRTVPVVSSLGYGHGLGYGAGLGYGHAVGYGYGIGHGYGLGGLKHG